MPTIETAQISANGDGPEAAAMDAIETAAPDERPDSQPEVVYNFAEMDDIELVTRQLALMKKIKRARKKQASAIAKADKSLNSKREKIAGKQAEISRLQGEIAELQEQADTLERSANDPDIQAQLAEHQAELDAINERIAELSS